MDDVTRQALATASGVLAAVYISLAMGLADPYWAALSVMIIANVDRDQLFTKGVLRITGTIVGVSLGYLAGQWLEGLPVQQMAFASLAAGISTYGRQRSTYGYAWFYGGITFALVVLYTMQQPQDLYSLAWNRCYEIGIGVTCGTLANWALGPRAGELGHLVATPTTATHEGALKQSLIAALGTSVLVVAWSLFALPQLPQVLISCLVLIDADPVASRHRGFQRIVGCIIGGTAGLVVIGLDATEEWWWATALFLGVFFFARVHLAKSAQTYIGTQSAIAYLVTLVSTGPPVTLDPPVERLVGIVIGVSIMTTLVWALNARQIAAEEASKG
ncbi:FUSC family protein [Ancylobacter oerskovii]|uniref:FUSC family protein n=1 Tax=Ancylobacter oerskovii TaxID=459519 RepID=A0ABW4YX97_9HYPH|nr:FUSC family protein [Ancylobacter oerskovii]MBS7542239.1 FUSC family protein [Ancylobacter oerskovii]